MALFGMFGRRPFDPDRVDWLFDHFAWLLANYGGHEAFLRSYHLVMPNRKDFPIGESGDADNVDRAFRAIMGHMGMRDWAVKLVPMGGSDDPAPSDYQRDTSEQSMSSSADGVGGYFLQDSLGRVTIGYGPQLTSDFSELVSVLSHEASHYLLTKSVTVMPGGWKDLEPCTDLTAIFTGFGIFQANTASVVQHYADGFTSSSSGYLPESGRAYALAIFSELSMLDPKFVAKQLRPNPRASYRAAIAELQSERADDLHRLETTEALREW